MKNVYSFLTVYALIASVLVCFVPLVHCAFVESGYPRLPVVLSNVVKALAQCLHGNSQSWCCSSVPQFEGVQLKRPCVSFSKRQMTHTSYWRLLDLCWLCLSKNKAQNILTWAPKTNGHFFEKVGHNSLAVQSSFAPQVVVTPSPEYLLAVH